MSAGADGDERSIDVRELVKAFARAMGFWPNGHDEWGTWCAAFKPLAEQGVSPAELASRSRAYLDRWQLEVGPDSPAFMFSLTKHYQRISASLERSYFGLFRWATENSWRLGDVDHARWVVETCDAITGEERRRLLAIVDEAYSAHADPVSEFHQWVERKGWALDDDEWRRELAARTDSKRWRNGSVMRREANERRRSIRTAFAQLDLGTRSDVA